MSLLAACWKNEPAYFPLDGRSRWQYDIAVKTTELIKRSKMLVAGLPKTELGGNPVYVNRMNDGTLYFYVADKDGIRRVGTKRVTDGGVVADTAEHVVLAYPIKIGATWNQKSATGVLEATVDPFRRHISLKLPVELRYSIESVTDEVTVPAGRFRDCVRVHGVGDGRYQGDKAILASDIHVDHTDWYAPGVGLVKTVRIETTTSAVLPRGEYLMELQSFERR